MALTLCSDLSPARWLVASSLGLPWNRLATFGPAEFECYARLRFLPDPAYEGQSEDDVELDDAPDIDPLHILFEVLADHTTTPDDCYFCLWDGYGEIYSAGPTPLAADPSELDGPGEGQMGAQPTSIADSASTPGTKVVLPNRAYYLFHGPLSQVRVWGPANPWGYMGDEPDPALVWPSDHAWCVASDVDVHWAGIGADELVIDRLIGDQRLDVVRADPRSDQPSYE